MFMAHLPAGYLVTRGLLRTWDWEPSAKARLMFLGLTASIAPDFDLLYHYTIDERAHSHHTYWTHTPAFWCLLTLVLWIFAAVCQSKLGRYGAWVIGAGALVHLVLDTVTGAIRWFHPFDAATYPLAVVPRHFESFWYLNYVVHWTFLVELTLVGAALWTLKRESQPDFFFRLRRPRRPRRKPPRIRGPL